MTSRKVTYQVKEKPRKAIMLTGNVYLQYVDEEALELPLKGDLLMFAYSDALHSNRTAEYEDIGITGYFKLDVFDGFAWKPVLVTEIFKDGEHHFSKKERPLDTYNVCADIVRALKGTELVRTYREHYHPDDGSTPEEPIKKGRRDKR